MGKEAYTRFRVDIRREIGRSVEKADKLRQRLTADEITESQMRSMAHYLAQIRDRLDSADFATKRQILEPSR
jgi:hypothetical protein